MTTATLVDLAMVVNHRTVRQAVRRAQGFRHLSLPMLLTAIVATGPAPTVSETEDVLLDLVVAGGFEHPTSTRPSGSRGDAWFPTFAGRGRSG